jgi:hypothetical protein
MERRTIKSITIVTAQGVNTYNTETGYKIQPDFYRVSGDLHPCFLVIDGKVCICEIRCIHNVEIEYFK